MQKVSNGKNLALKHRLERTAASHWQDSGKPPSFSLALGLKVKNMDVIYILLITGIGLLLFWWIPLIVTIASILSYVYYRRREDIKRPALAALKTWLALLLASSLGLWFFCYDMMSGLLALD